MNITDARSAIKGHKLTKDYVDSTQLGSDNDVVTAWNMYFEGCREGVEKICDIVNRKIRDNTRTLNDIAELTKSSGDNLPCKKFCPASTTCHVVSDVPGAEEMRAIYEYRRYMRINKVKLNTSEAREKLLAWAKAYMIDETEFENDAQKLTESKIL